tara:strand:+ start:307 stop:801 length:495 start_codon:yes stop_codon:yes gene_type:complete
MKIIKNFINDEDCDKLSEWIEDRKDLDLFQDANMKGNRLTTRYTTKDIVYPQVAFEIRNKIITHLNLKNFKLAPFKYGMYASIAFKGDDCYLHKDPRHFENHITLHCNLKLNDTDGGDVLIEKDNYEVQKGDIWIYPTSEINHGSNTLLSDKRLIWVYGFCICE